MNTTTAIRRRSINRLRDFTDTLARLWSCQASKHTLIGASTFCTRVATARQTYIPMTGGPERVTYRCGTHRIPLTAPDLVSTETSLSGFSQEVAR